MDISVIIPVKNRASLLPATLDCVLSQSLQPFEVIVVDDASTDDIESVMSKYRDRVIFINSGGKGPGAARNAGLKIAKGDVIQFFDSDDLMTHNKFEVQAALLEKESADLVYGPWVKAVLDEGSWKQADVIMQYYRIPAGQFADFVLQGWCNITQSALFRKALIDKVGFWREDIMTHEDFEYWFRIAKEIKKHCHENQSCVIYRQHQHQITDLDVSNQSRWMDGIKAMQHIANEVDNAHSLNSMWLFKGRNANSKYEFIKKFGKNAGVKIELFALFYMVYFKIKDKLGRVPDTIWQKMHGVSKSPVAFKEYVEQL